MTQMQILTTALPIIIPVGCVVLTAYLSIKIKFAPDAEHAIRDVKAIFLKALIWVGGLLCLGRLLRELLSPLPLTRLSCFIIVINSFGLWNLLEHSKFMMILGALETVTTAIIRHRPNGTRKK